jgi:hypothetical protein
MKFFIFIILLNLLVNTSVLKADELSKSAEKLFNHYGYDDRINNYIKSLFSFGNSDKNKKITSVCDNSINKCTNSINTNNSYKSSLKFKSKNKLIYSFSNGQSIQINPSNFDNEIIYKSNSLSYFKIDKDTVYYGINFDF